MNILWYRGDSIEIDSNHFGYEYVFLSSFPFLFRIFHSPVEVLFCKRDTFFLIINVLSENLSEPK